MTVRLPNFFVIGAMKAATTSIWNYLGQHPDIYMSPIKETRYFAVKSFEPGKIELLKKQPLWKGTVLTFGEYAQLFQDVKDELVVGEASPLYMVYPFVSKNIHEMIPHAKILACLRQPAERAFSHFQHNRKNGFEKRSEFIEAFHKDACTNYAGYFRLGFYSAQMRYYFSRFSADQIKICYYDHFMKNPDGALSDIFKFLGVDPDFKPDMHISYNKGAHKEFLNDTEKMLLTLSYLDDIRKLEKMDSVDLGFWYTYENKDLNVDEQDMYLSPWFYI